MSLLLWPALAFGVCCWLERELMGQSRKYQLLLPLGLLILTVVFYLLSEHQRGLAGFEYLFYALITGCGVLGAAVGWLTGKVDKDP